MNAAALARRTSAALEQSVPHTLPLLLCSSLQLSSAGSSIWVEAFWHQGTWWFLLDAREALMSALERGDELLLISESFMAQARACMTVHPWLMPELATRCTELYGSRFMMREQLPSLRLVRLEIIWSVCPPRWHERLA